MFRSYIRRGVAKWLASVLAASELGPRFNSQPASQEISSLNYSDEDNGDDKKSKNLKNPHKNSEFSLTIKAKIYNSIFVSNPSLIAAAVGGQRGEALRPALGGRALAVPEQVVEAVCKTKRLHCNSVPHMDLRIRNLPPADPDPSSVKECSVAEAQKHMDPADPNPDADPEQWYIYIIFQR